MTQNKFHIPGLMTSSVSKGVVDYIVNQARKLAFSDLNLYVSNTGDDATADGSSEKPFKTLEALFDYTLKTYRATKTLFSVIVRFKDDYVMSSGMLTIPCSCNYRWIIDGRGHNVTLSGLNCFNNTYVNIKNVTFIYNHTSNATVVNVTSRSHVVFEDCKFKYPSILVDDYFRSNRFSIIELNGTTEISSSPENLGNIKNLIRAYLNGTINVNGTINAMSDLKANVIVYSGENSYIGLQTLQLKFNTNGHTVTGNRYRVDSNACINTKGRGENFIFGDHNGYVDTYGVYI